jgi:uncharacterized protein Usg
MVSEDFRKQALGYGLTTAHILYRRPDHRWLLQSYVWQNYDLFPQFPELRRFLAFWQNKLEGPLHSVRVAHCKLIKPAEFKAVDGNSGCISESEISPAPHAFSQKRSASILKIITVSADAVASTFGTD